MRIYMLSKTNKYECKWKAHSDGKGSTQQKKGRPSQQGQKHARACSSTFAAYTCGKYTSACVWVCKC